MVLEQEPRTAAGGRCNVRRIASRTAHGDTFRLDRHPAAEAHCDLANELINDCDRRGELLTNDKHVARCASELLSA